MAITSFNKIWTLLLFDFSINNAKFNNVINVMMSLILTNFVDVAISTMKKFVNL